MLCHRTAPVPGPFVVQGPPYYYTIATFGHIRVAAQAVPPSAWNKRISA